MDPGDARDAAHRSDAPRGVEMDRDRGYLDGGGRWPLGSTALRNRLLRAWGMTVVSVTYYEWDRLGTPQAKRAHIAELLKRAVEDDGE